MREMLVGCFQRCVNDLWGGGLADLDKSNRWATAVTVFVENFIGETISGG
jgi:hypothetical protein